MKVHRLVTVLAVMAVFGFAAVAIARGPHAGGGWGCGSDYVRMYNPDSVVKFSGTITKIDKVQMMEGAAPGIHIMVTGEDPCTASPIHLGPAWYIENQDMKLNVGDKVKITGSKVKLGDETVIIAREIKRGDDVLVLRNEAGVPNWAGWRKRAK